jgi:hypothetical protein
MSTRYRNGRLFPAGFFAFQVLKIAIGQLAPKQISIIDSKIGILNVSLIIFYIF